MNISGSVTIPTKVDYDKPMKFRLNPTVREINRYLSPLIDELTIKHVKVSNPEFEEELKKITGIGWKQAKNYRNHPKPGQRINDNALINEWIFNCRKNDKKRKFINYSLYLIGAILLIVVFSKLYSILSQERLVIIKQPVGPALTRNNLPKTLETKYSLTIPSHKLTVRLGSLKNQNIDLREFNCLKHTQSLETCNRDTMNEDGSVLSSIMYISDGIINSITISAVGENSKYMDEVLYLIKSLDLKQKNFEERAKSNTKITSENGNEKITINLGKHEGNKKIISAQIQLELITN